jgi:hypothetical protein
MGYAVQQHGEMDLEGARMTEWWGWRASLWCCSLVVLKLVEKKQTTRNLLQMERRLLLLWPEARRLLKMMLHYGNECRI